MSAPTETNSRRSQRIAWLALFCVLAALVAYVGLQSRMLPDRVATHFDLHGTANGWMLRETHRKFSLGLGLGSPLFIVGVFALIRAFGGAGLNVPNKEFWLAPERRQGTFDFIQRQGVWLAVQTAAFHAGLFYVVLDANSRRPAFLPSWEIWSLAGFFLVLLGVWMVTFLRHFRQTVP